MARLRWRNKGDREQILRLEKMLKEFGCEKKRDAHALFPDGTVLDIEFGVLRLSHLKKTGYHMTG